MRLLQRNAALFCGVGRGTLQQRRARGGQRGAAQRIEGWQGTWCSLRPHQWSRYLKALQEPSARVVFASADWANGWRGFIDGAIEQGLLAGRRVRSLLS